MLKCFNCIYVELFQTLLCAHMHVQVCAHVHVQVCAHTCASARTCTCASVGMCVCTCMCASVRECACASVRIYACKCVRMCVWKCVRGISCSVLYIRTVDCVLTCSYCVADTGIKFVNAKYGAFHNVLRDYKHL
jgi:hypothetical protein